ncbi:MAG: hypothetical protein OXR73_33010 [Myxococcales bacterium]|nr:hypothetical protein [Myxococcales bacterium]
MDISRADSEAIKIWLALAALLLIILWPWLCRLSARGSRFALVGLVLVAGLNYARWGPELPFAHIDAYDVIHYYVGAKYFDELGYYDLYPALLLIDHEHGPYSHKLRRYRAQDRERGYRGGVRLRHALERGRALRNERFSPKRWAELEHDFLTLQRKRSDRMPRGLWVTMMNDRGFNGTPVWLLAGQAFANLVPVEAIKLLCALDGLLLAAALVAVGWTYGTSAALWACVFLFVSYSLRWPVVSWAVLRYDWVAALLFGMVLLRRGHPAWAGVVTGYASLVRLFPAAWMFGPFCQAVARMFRPGLPWRQRLDRRHLRLAAGFVLAVGVLTGAAATRYGPDAIATHADNIAHHIKPEELSSRRVGFALATVFEGKTKPKILPLEKKVQIKKNATIRLLIGGLLLLLLAAGLRDRPTDEAFAYGLLPFFMLTTASYYYFVCRITLVVWHAAELSHTRNRVGLAALMGLELFSNASEVILPLHRVFLVGGLAWGLTIYAVTMTAWLLYDSRKSSIPGDAKPP